jgi:myosin heavy subunit
VKEPNMGPTKKKTIQAEIDRRQGTRTTNSTRKSTNQAPRVNKSSGPTKTEKLEKQLEKQQKQIENARKKRDSYKQRSKSYEKYAKEVNSLVSEERKIKKEAGLL